MKTYKQFVEQSYTSFDRAQAKEREKKEREKEKEEMTAEITRDVLARVGRKTEKLRRDTPNPYAN